MDLIIKRDNGKTNEASIEVITSKSYVHRLMIAAGLSMDSVLVMTNTVSKDMEATAGCIRALGAEITQTGDGYRIVSPVKKKVSAELFCNESGSTARFILPVASYLTMDNEHSITLTGEGKLPERPFGPLCEALKSTGTTVSAEYLPISVSGGLSSGHYSLPGNVSSQYVSGMLFALPLAQGSSVLELTSRVESVGYINMTLEVLKEFGIQIETEVLSGEDGIFMRFNIPGGQKYRHAGKKRIQAEGDWSNGAFLMAIGVLNGGMKITGLNCDSIQGDRASKDLYEGFGALISKEEDGGISIARGELNAMEFDASQIPDLVPALAVIAAFAKGDTKIKNIERLRIKESDRIETVTGLLSKAGIETVIEDERREDSSVATHMIVKGNPEGLNAIDKMIEIDGANDHRIVMAAAILASGINAPVKIMGYQAVEKSYPNFFDICENILGMNIERM